MLSMLSRATGVVAAVFCGAVVGAQGLSDLPTNRWVPVEVRCEQGDPELYGGCPSGRGWVQLAYDHKRDRVVLFGGSSAWYMNDLWYFDPAERVWTMILQDTRAANVEKDWHEYPRGRDNHNFVYDADEDVYWMYGGTGKGGMWRFDPEQRTWEALWPEHGMGPLTMASMDPGFAYSGHHDSILLFGGTRYSPRDATWWFDTDSERWQELSPATHPEARTQIENAMVYDPTRKQFILFGGQAKGRNRTPLDDTWIFDTATRSWKNMKPPVAPPARDRHILTYDEKNDVVVMLGGHEVADTWLYFPEQNQWRELVSARGDFDHEISYVSSAVYIPKHDITLYRDRKGNMYYLRLDLGKDIAAPANGPVEPLTLE